MRTFPKRCDDFVTYIALITNNGEPSCYQEAIKVSKSSKWTLAMNEEMDALENNKTWDLVELLMKKDLLVASGSTS